jgi:hypothetical protein
MVTEPRILATPALDRELLDTQAASNLKPLSPDSFSSAPPPVRLVSPKRLASYTLPDLAVVAEESARGVSVKSIWRRYAATAAAPIGYVAFARRVARASRTIASGATAVLPNIRGDVPDATVAEHVAAEQYWADRGDPRSSIHLLSGYGCSLKVEHGLLSVFDTGESRKYEPVNHRLSAIVFTGKAGIMTLEAIKWCQSNQAQAKGVAAVVVRIPGAWKSDIRRAAARRTPG